MSAPTQSVRRNVYLRDAERCVRCAATVLLSFQHRAAVGMGGTRAKPTAEEGVTACLECNARFEGDLQAVALANGWKVPRWVQKLGRIADVPVFYAPEGRWFILAGRGRDAITSAQAKALMRDVYGLEQYDQMEAAA
ncbi:hypothetical protein C5E10_06245 [Pseudoclavibacter sp. RFBG4]|uniref:hypothetical protein n=1 Tax=Pseudoclavibacter sp. RFBG4 TaxID=2080575 RepID=UPI000CE910BF|nr:hypothetical protein [Pseudoclavibacter sp. RFBG4]PPG35188.1 hypothetical protein C5E10_06245 [Pseudoclavibacter sp. RFBG4]